MACDRVLVVDDDRDNCDTIGELLLLSGVREVRCARSIAEAERVLANGFEPSAVVLDLLLGHERGDAFEYALRREPRYRSVPVVYISGDPAGLRPLRDRRVPAFLKPFSPDELARTLHELCDARQARGMRDAHELWRGKDERPLLSPCDGAAEQA